MKLIFSLISAALMNPRLMPMLLAVEIMVAQQVTLGSASLLDELLQK